MKTKTVRKIQGIHAFHAAAVVVAWFAAAATSCAGGLKDSSAGRQKRINTTTANIATAALTMSTSQGP